MNEISDMEEKKKSKLRLLQVFTPQNLLRMGYCFHCTRTCVNPYLRTYVHTSKIFFEFFVVFGIVTLVVLDDFSIFEKNDFLGLPRPFFDHFSDI